MLRRSLHRRIKNCPTAIFAAFVVLSGCSLTPAGTEEEQGRAADAGLPYESPFEERVIPELSKEPTWQDVLHRAFLANGELEANYFEWRGAVDRIDAASAYPNAKLSLGYSYLFSPGNMKSFDRMSFSASPDPMMNLSFPLKVRKAGQMALSEAQASGERFRAAKFDLQRRVLFAVADYYLAGEKARIAHEQQNLAQIVATSAKARSESGGSEKDLIKGDLDFRIAEDSLRQAEAEVTSTRARLNALLGREPTAEIVTARLFEKRPFAAADNTLIKVAVSENPELAALRRDIESRDKAVDLARLEWIPDVNPTAVFTGGASQAIGFAAILPTTIPKIRSEIEQAQAALRSAEAILRQTRNDRAAQFVASLVSFRFAERQEERFRDEILPLATRLNELSLQSYTNGQGSLLDLSDSRNTLLGAQLTQIEARVLREKMLVELESLMGRDIETVGDTR